MTHDAPTPAPTTPSFGYDPVGTERRRLFLSKIREDATGTADLALINGHAMTIAAALVVSQHPDHTDQTLFVSVPFRAAAFATRFNTGQEIRDTCHPLQPVPAFSLRNGEIEAILTGVSDHTLHVHTASGLVPAAPEAVTLAIALARQFGWQFDVCGFTGPSPAQAASAYFTVRNAPLAPNFGVPVTLPALAVRILLHALDQGPTPDTLAAYVSDRDPVVIAYAYEDGRITPAPLPDAATLTGATLHPHGGVMRAQAEHRDQPRPTAHTGATEPTRVATAARKVQVSIDTLAVYGPGRGHTGPTLADLDQPLVPTQAAIDLAGGSFLTRPTPPQAAPTEEAATPSPAPFTLAGDRDPLTDDDPLIGYLVTNGHFRTVDTLQRPHPVDALHEAYQCAKENYSARFKRAGMRRRAAEALRGVPFLPTREECAAVIGQLTQLDPSPADELALRRTLAGLKLIPAKAAGTYAELCRIYHLD